MLAWLLLAAACAPDDTKDSGDPPPINQGGGDTADCDTNAPVIESFTVYNGGIFTFESVDWPSMVAEASISDEDKDLELVRMDVWFDDVVDGAVDTSGEAPLAGEPYAQDEYDPCTLGTNTYRLRFAVTGNRFLYATPYEFAGVVYDAHATPSEVAIASATTPNEDGSDAAR